MPAQALRGLHFAPLDGAIADQDSRESCPPPPRVYKQNRGRAPVWMPLALFSGIVPQNIAPPPERLSGGAIQPGGAAIAMGK